MIVSPGKCWAYNDNPPGGGGTMISYNSSTGRAGILMSIYDAIGPKVSWPQLCSDRDFCTAISFPLRRPSETSEKCHYLHRQTPRYSNPAENRKPFWWSGFLYTLWDPPQ